MYGSDRQLLISHALFLISKAINRESLFVCFKRDLENGEQMSRVMRSTRTGM